jgi:phosphoribosylformylglycinamidine synthase subunit PurSL
LRPETLGSLIEAARGCYDAAIHYRAPFISGKDSFNNEYLGTDGLRHAIPPTLLISAIGLIDDVNRAVTMDLKEAGNVVYLIENTEFRHLPPKQSGAGMQKPEVYRSLHQAICAGLVRACHDLSEGGLAVAAAEMCIGGRLGLALTIDADDPATALFGESNGRLLVEVRASDGAAFETYFSQTPNALRRCGLVSGGPRLSISSRTQELVSAPIAQLVAAWNGKSPIKDQRSEI